MHRHRWLIALAVASWTVTALLATGLTLSYWYDAAWYSRTTIVSVRRGYLERVEYAEGSGMSVLGGGGWQLGPLGKPPIRSVRLTWPTLSARLPTPTTYLLWPWLVVPVAAAVFITHRAIVACGRARTGSCPSCGYNLAGLAPDAACPECGAVRARSPAVGG